MKVVPIWADTVPSKNPAFDPAVYDLAFSPNGATVVAAVGTRVHVYDAETGDTRRVLRGHKDYIYSIAFTHDGTRFATGGADNTVIIWSAECEGIVKYTHADPIQSLSFSPISQLLVSATASEFGLWSPDQPTVTKVKTHSPIRCTAWSPDGLTLALGLADGTISLRDAHGAEKASFKRSAQISCLAFLPPDRSAASRVGISASAASCVAAGAASIADWGPGWFPPLAVGCWDQTLSFYTAAGQLGGDKALGYDPSALAVLPLPLHGSVQGNGAGDEDGDGSGREYALLCGGSDKCISLYTRWGSFLRTLACASDWVWVVRATPLTASLGGGVMRGAGASFCLGTQGGELLMAGLQLGTVHSMNEGRYAKRVGLTDVVVHKVPAPLPVPPAASPAQADSASVGGVTPHALKTAAPSVRMRVRTGDFVKRVALCGTRMALQLTDRVLVYDAAPPSKPTVHAGALHCSKTGDAVDYDDEVTDAERAAEAADTIHNAAAVASLSWSSSTDGPFFGPVPPAMVLAHGLACARKRHSRAALAQARAALAQARAGVSEARDQALVPSDEGSAAEAMMSADVEAQNSSSSIDYRLVRSLPIAPSYPAMHVLSPSSSTSSGNTSAGVTAGGNRTKPPQPSRLTSLLLGPVPPPAAAAHAPTLTPSAAAAAAAAPTVGGSTACDIASCGSEGLESSLMSLTDRHLVLGDGPVLRVFHAETGAQEGECIFPAHITYLAVVPPVPTVTVPTVTASTHASKDQGGLLCGLWNGEVYLYVPPSSSQPSYSSRACSPLLLLRRPSAIRCLSLSCDRSLLATVGADLVLTVARLPATRLDFDAGRGRCAAGRRGKGKRRAKEVVEPLEGVEIVLEEEGVASAAFSDEAAGVVGYSSADGVLTVRSLPTVTYNAPVAVVADEEKSTQSKSNDDNDDDEHAHPPKLLPAVREPVPGLVIGFHGPHLLCLTATTVAAHPAPTAALTRLCLSALPLPSHTLAPIHRPTDKSTDRSRCDAGPCLSGGGARAALSVSALGGRPSDWQAVAGSALAGLDLQAARAALERSAGVSGRVRGLMREMRRVLARNSLPGSTIAPVPQQMTTVTVGTKTAHLLRALVCAHLGNYPAASELFIAAGEPDRAVAMHLTLLDWASARAVLARTSGLGARVLLQRQAEWCLSVGDVAGAAGLLWKADEWDKAVGMWAKLRKFRLLFARVASLSEAQAETETGKAAFIAAADVLERAGRLANSLALVQRLGDLVREQSLLCRTDQWDVAHALLTRARSDPSCPPAVLAKLDNASTFWLRYAQWLAGRGRFADAHDAFRRAGKGGRAEKVLIELAAAAAEKGELEAAAHFYHLLAVEADKEAAALEAKAATNGTTEVARTVNTTTSDRAHARALRLRAHGLRKVSRLYRACAPALAFVSPDAPPSLLTPTSAGAGIGVGEAAVVVSGTAVALGMIASRAGDAALGLWKELKHRSLTFASANKTAPASTLNEKAPMPAPLAAPDPLSLPPAAAIPRGLPFPLLLLALARAAPRAGAGGAGHSALRALVGGRTASANSVLQGEERMMMMMLPPGVRAEVEAAAAAAGITASHPQNTTAAAAAVSAALSSVSVSFSPVAMSNMMSTITSASAAPPTSSDGFAGSCPRCFAALPLLYGGPPPSAPPPAPVRAGAAPSDCCSACGSEVVRCDRSWEPLPLVEFIPVSAAAIAAFDEAKSDGGGARLEQGRLRDSAVWQLLGSALPRGGLLSAPQTYGQMLASGESGGQDLSAASLCVPPPATCEGGLWPVPAVPPAWLAAAALEDVFATAGVTVGGDRVTRWWRNVLPGAVRVVQCARELQGQGCEALFLREEWEAAALSEGACCPVCRVSLENVAL